MGMLGGYAEWVCWVGMQGGVLDGYAGWEMCLC